MKKNEIIGFIALMVIIIFLFIQSATAMDTGTIIAGVTFNDTNGDGVRGINETGLPDVQISNGMDVISTDKFGFYRLPKDGTKFVFITTPGEYTTTTSWYHRITDEDFDFGLSYTPEKNVSEFTFVHMTDVHLCKDSTECEEIFGHPAFANPKEFFDQTIGEINEMEPDLVVNTGDLIALGDKVTISKAKKWYELYNSSISNLHMPIHSIIGNHDVVGIYNYTVDVSDPKYGKGMYEEYFGPTYYSFNCGPYHCVVLDPNHVVDRRLRYEIPEKQLNWLREDLAYNQDLPILVFFHEPTNDWKNRAEVLDILKSYNVIEMFSGHWHNDVLLDSDGIPEQVTGAVCGCWWYGPCPDGRPSGYRIIYINDSNISAFYKEIGKEKQINIVNPSDPVMSGNITLKVQIYSDYDLIDVSYRIDSGELIPMEIIKDKVWDTAIISWDTTQVAEGYHTITIEVEDEEGFKVYVKSPPIGGKANKELIEVLAEYFKIKKREVRIIKGEKSKEKIVEIGYL